MGLTSAEEYTFHQSRRGSENYDAANIKLKKDTTTSNTCDHTTDTLPPFFRPPINLTWVNRVAAMVTSQILEQMFN
jgi:hypothetical protein